VALSAGYRKFVYVSIPSPRLETSNYFIIQETQKIIQKRDTKEEQIIKKEKEKEKLSVTHTHLISSKNPFCFFSILLARVVAGCSNES